MAWRRPRVRVPYAPFFLDFFRRYQLVIFENDELVIKPIVKAAFWKNKKDPV